MRRCHWARATGSKHWLFFNAIEYIYQQSR